MRRRLAIGLAVVLAIGAALLLLISIAQRPFVERRVLAWGLAQLEQFGIEGRADRLEYSLANLDVRLYNVRLSVLGRSDQPFFAADEVHATFGWPIVRGMWAVDKIELTRGSLVYAKRSDGRSNWPASSGPSLRTVSTPPRPIGVVSVHDFSVSWHDEVSGLSVDVPGTSIELTPSARGISGPVTLNEPARLSWRDRSTEARLSNASLSYDGTTVQISSLRLDLPEASFQMSGRIDRLFDERTLALDVQSTAHMETLAPWLGVTPAPRGDVDITATIRGAASDPTLTATVASRQAEWAGFRGMSGSAAVSIGSGGVSVTSLAWRMARGELSGTGRFAFDTSKGSDVALDWRNLDEAALLAAVAPSSTVSVRSELSGRLVASWPGLRATMRAESSALDGPSGVRGTLVVGVQDGMWTGSVDQWVGEAIHATGTLAGRLMDRPGDTTLGGTMTIEAEDVSRVRQAMRALGIVEADETTMVSGAAQVSLKLAGTVSAPQASGSMMASDVRVGAIGPAMASANVEVSSKALTVASGEVSLGADRLNLSGSVVFDTKAVEGQAGWTIPDISALVTNLPEHFRPAGSLQGTGTVAGRWDDVHARAAIEGGSLAFVGQEAGRWSASLQLDGQTLTVNDLAIEQAGGRISARGEYGLRTQAYAVSVTGRQLQLAPLRWGPSSAGDDAPLPVRSRFDLDFTGAGTLDDPRGRGTIAASELSWGDWSIGNATLGVNLANRAAAFDVAAPSLFLKAQANLGLQPYGRFDVDASVSGGDLTELLGHLPQAPQVSITGATTFEVRASGDLNRLSDASGQVDLQQLDAKVGDTPLKLGAPARISYGSDQVTVNALALTLGGARIDVGGQLGAAAGGLRGSVSGPLADVVTTARAVGTAYMRDLPPFDLSGNVQLDVAARGSVQAPEISAGLSVTESRFVLSTYPAFTDLAVQATYRDGVFGLDRLQGMWQGASISATGRLPAAMLDFLPLAYRNALPPGGGLARLDARADALTLAALAPLVSGTSASTEKLEGEVAATLALQADGLSVDRVRGELNLDRADLVLSGVALSQRRPTRIAFEQGHARVVDFDWAGPGGTIVVGGTFDLGENAALNLTTTGTIDLRIIGIFLPNINTGGRAQLDARVDGTTNQPQLGGRVEVAGGEFRQASPRIAVSGLAGALVLDGNRIYSPEPMQGAANGGTVSLTVDLRLPSVSSPEGRIAIDGRGLAAEVPTGLRSEVDADLTVQIAAGAPTIGGTVTVLRGTYRDPLSVTSGLVAALRQPAPVSAESSSPLDSAALDIRVFTQEDIRVDNNYARLALGADVRIVGTLAQPNVLGRASPREGGQIFLGGHTYRLNTDGSIDFSNPSRIEPDMNITAVTRVRDYDITLGLKGTPAQLQTDLTSDPPLDRTDLVSLLVTGQTLSESQGQALIGTEQVLGLLSGDVLSTTGRAVGLDVLRVEQGSPSAQFNGGLVATDTNPGSRLTFGKRVTSNTELIFSQSLRESGDLTWIVSYAPRPQIELRVVSDDTHNRSYDFRHDLSFGGPRTAGVVRRSAVEPRVASVQFAGDAGNVDQRDLIDVLKLKTGSRFDFFKWQDDRDRLAELLHRRGFLEARVEADHGPLVDSNTPVGLTYTLDRGPRTLIVVRGYTLSDATKRALEDAWTQAVFDEFVLDEMKTIVRTDLASSGYVWATVGAAVQPPTSPDEKQIVIQVDRGNRAAHRLIELRGNDRIPTAELEKAIDARSLGVRAWVDPASLQSALTSVYKDAGMLAASVTVQPIAMREDDAVLTVDIVEGPLFLISTVALEGNAAQSDQQVRAWLRLDVGAPYRTQAIEDARRRLETEYRKRGFTRVAIEMTVSRAADGETVQLAVQVREGPRQVLQGIQVDGADRASPALVSRILNLGIGSPVDLSEWQEARRRLYDTSVFRRVDVQQEVVQPSDRGDEPVRARVGVEEWPLVRFRYGIGIADQVNDSGDARTFRPGLSSDVTFRNVFGLAATTGGSVQYTKDDRAARVFLTFPVMFGRPIVSNFFVSRTHESNSEPGASPFVTDKTDVTAEQRIRPLRALEITYSYNFERNHTFALGFDPNDPLAFDLIVNIVRLGSTLRFDSRNDLVDATRGWFHSSSLEYAPEALGSDLSFAKYLIIQNYYRRLFGRVVGASALRMGLATAFGQDLIPSERFFAGGGNSVRGYLQDSLSPHLFGQPVGGNALLVFNEELRFPILWRFRGVGFFDAGRAFERVGDLSIRGLGTSVGFGLRVDTPVALLRVDFGRPINPRVNESGRTLFFSIGQAF